MNHIIFDVEATCWETRHAKSIMEIIEIGAVRINDKLEISDHFDQFVRPVVNPRLSRFCADLTHITQVMVDGARHFPEVLSDFRNFACGHGEEYLLCSWGYYDKNQVVSDSKLHYLDSTWITRHISLKHQYAQIKKLRRPVGLIKALELEGLTFAGKHHRGIDDAENVARIFVRHFEEWVY